MFKYYFDLVQWFTVLGNLTFFYVCADAVQWRIGAAEGLIGILLANSAIVLYTPWFKHLASDLQGAKINTLSYLAPALIGFGGVAACAYMVSRDNFGFWLLFVMPFAQALLFNLFLALMILLVPWLGAWGNHRESTGTAR
jgi:hypothetical protein